MTTDNKKEKKNKKKGPIRYEAIIPVLIITLLTFGYFSFYFDYHMKKVIEYVGTRANGAEVNVDGVRTSFIMGSFDLDRLQVTDPEKPTHNSIEIGNVHFQYLWDALLRMKFVVEDAGINNIQLLKPRTSPGKVLPPEPARPSKMDQIQDQVMGQVKKKYGNNMLGDALALMGGTNYQDQIDQIRGSLESEKRAQAMVSDVKSKEEFWDKKITSLSDTSKIKEVETTIKNVQQDKDIWKQAQGIKKLTDLLGDLQKQYKDVQKASDQLQAEVKTITNYPNELQALVNKDVASLKSRFSIPQLDFKDMAMHLFAGQFAGYITKARKYQAVAEQYIPEKKEQEDEVIPPKRSEGENYEFPITAGYPLFWLKKAAISSKGTADSYSGNVSGELTNVTTSPKQIKKPIILDLRGDFPDVKVHGVKALLTADFTKAIGKQSALIQVNSFKVPQKLFVDDKDMKFGFLEANGATTITAELVEKRVNMNWNSVMTKPQFLVETGNKAAKEMLSKILNDIPVINIDGKATGSFDKLNMQISSNLGTELAQGFTREVGAKVNEAQQKINTLVEDRLQNPRKELMSAIGGNKNNLSQLGSLEEVYKKNENKIKAEIAKLKSGGGTDALKEKGKKLLKGIKF